MRDVNSRRGFSDFPNEMHPQRFDNATQCVESNPQRVDNKTQRIDNDAQRVEIVTQCVDNEIQRIYNALTTSCHAFSRHNAFALIFLMPGFRK